MCMAQSKWICLCWFLNWNIYVITGINPENVYWGEDHYYHPLCPGLQPGPPSQTPGGLGQRCWSVSEVTWPPNLEFRRWGSLWPSIQPNDQHVTWSQLVFFFIVSGAEICAYKINWMWSEVGVHIYWLAKFYLVSGDLPSGPVVVPIFTNMDWF